VGVKSCQGDDGRCPKFAAADGYCDEHHPLRKLLNTTQREILRYVEIETGRVRYRIDPPVYDFNRNGILRAIPIPDARVGWLWCPRCCMNVKPTDVRRDRETFTSMTVCPQCYTEFKQPTKGHET